MRGFWFLWSCSQFRIKSAHQGISAYLSSQLSACQLSFWLPIQDVTDTPRRMPTASKGIQWPDETNCADFAKFVLALSWQDFATLHAIVPLLKSKEKETGWASGLSRQVGTDHGYQLTDNVSHIIMWHNIAIHTCIIENVLKMVRCVIVCLIYHSRNSIRFPPFFSATNSLKVGRCHVEP